MTSNSEFNKKTTAEQVGAAFKDRIQGKSFIVTGGNIGLGMETCRVLSKEGAGSVVLACRTVSKGEEAKKEIIKQFPQAKIEVMALDLASLKSIKAFADLYLKSGKSLNVLINNAGIYLARFLIDLILIARHHGLSIRKNRRWL